MPELPEVETVRQGLIPVMTKKRIAKVDQRRPDLRWPFPNDFAARLENSTILNISRRSKYLIFNLSTSETLVIHLGMSGRLLVLKGGQESVNEPGNFKLKTHKSDKHDHLILHLSSDVRIVYNDPRRFGAMDLIETKKIDDHKWLKNLGPEPLSTDFSVSYLHKKLQNCRGPVKSVLMNQTIVAGLGNIYALEVLWLAKVSPFRKAYDVRIFEVEELIVSIRTVLSMAIKAGGTSLRDFRQVGGDLGYFQQKLHVYGCYNKECKGIDCVGIIQKEKQSGRMSYYCNICQK